VKGAGAGSLEALAAAKQSLRRRIVSSRDAMGDASRAAACAAITSRLVRLERYGRSGIVAAYRSFGSEFDTTEFVADVLRAGKRLVLPRIDRAARRLAFHLVSDPGTQLVPGTWGIREPDPARCANVDLREVDFMLLPGVAFTRECDRLGYGGGFYDRALDALRPDCPGVAAAFTIQIVDSLPVGPNDRKVDAVLTESGQFGPAC
jgi:5-formyltetrahydrofolate cyclo-ligase